MIDEESVALKKKMQEKAETDAQNKGIAPQSPVQSGQSESGKSYAIVSMVLGIVAVVFILFRWIVSPICAVIGLVMSHMAKTQGYTGGLRMVGMVLSWMAIGLSVIMMAFVVLAYQMLMSIS